MFRNEKLEILYGSQTGNAQDLAERIWRESKRFYFQSHVQCMDEYSILDLTSDKCVIFICSTTGQGEEPDNMRQFWKFLLRKNLPPNSLMNLKFAVFGLGDSSYVKFNFVAKRLHKRLLQLGARFIIPLGLGDDQHDLGYDATADPWIESLFSSLSVIYPLPDNVKPLDRNYLITPRFSVTTNNNSIIQNNQSLFYSTRRDTDFTVNVLENNRTTDASHFQDVRLIKFESTSEISYNPGDVIVLRPRNLPWQVDAFKQLLLDHNLNFEENFTLNQKDPDVPMPPVLRQPLSFNQLCEEYFDLMAIPRRHTFNILSQITDSELEKEKCLEFTTAQGQDELYTYCNRPKRNIVEVLQDFPHATKNLTQELLFEIFPPIKPREFSIASSSKKHPNQVHILLAVVRYKTKLKKERYGLCSNYLAELKVGNQLSAFIRPGSFRFPKDEVPIIMIGPGTGVAPFRSFIMERCAEGKASSKNLVLFFGCRSQHLDFHCKDEFTELTQQDQLNLITAFSRDQEHKIYVQDKISENGQLVWSLIERGACIFIAGNAKLMPQAVREALVRVCEIHGKMDSAKAEIYVANLEKQKRYQTECWS